MLIRSQVVHHLSSLLICNLYLNGTPATSEMKKWIQQRQNIIAWTQVRHSQMLMKNRGGSPKRSGRMPDVCRVTNVHETYKMDNFINRSEWMPSTPNYTPDEESTTS